MKHTFKPNRFSVVVISLGFVISFIFLLINSYSLLNEEPNRRSVFGVVMSSFFFVASIIALLKFQTITVENGKWTFRKWITGRTKSFFESEIGEAVRSEHILYKSRRQVVTYRIYLESGDKFTVSSDSISDFHYFELKIRRFKKKTVAK